MTQPSSNEDDQFAANVQTALASDPIHTEWGKAQDKERQPYFHRGPWYFKRAFATSMGIMVAVSAFIAAWMVVWALTIGGLYGIGSSLGDDPTEMPSDYPTETMTSQEATDFPSCDQEADGC
jgi:hypothetical protein